MEYQNLEDLASDEVYKFAYVLGVNKIKGATAGTVPPSGTATCMLARSGRYFPIGSFSSSRPSSTSIMTPTETMGLVME